MLSDPVDPPATPADLAPWLREILRCPVCHHELLDAAGDDGRPELHCAEECDAPGRRRAYRIEDGIPVLLADEARILSVP